ARGRSSGIESAVSGREPLRRGFGPADVRDPAGDRDVRRQPAHYSTQGGARRSPADGHARLNSMSTLIVASSPKDWPFDIPDVDVIDAWDYLTQPKFSELRNVRI